MTNIYFIEDIGKNVVKIGKAIKKRKELNENIWLCEIR